MVKTAENTSGKPYSAATGKKINDIIAPVSRVKQMPTSKQSVSAKTQPTNVKAVPKKTRVVASHSKHRSPQPSQTLMRRAVKKPAAGLKKQLHVQQPMSQNRESISVKHAVNRVDETKLRRAQQTQTHSQVNRFHAPAAVPVTLAPVPVKEAPRTTSSIKQPSTTPPVPARAPADMFEKAIANATHYVDIAERKAHFKKHARRHAFTMIAGILFLVRLGAFTTDRNTRSLQIKVAGVVAGVSTQAPDFKAAGFVYDGVAAHGTKLIYGFRNSLTRYQLVEQTTNWSGQEMIDQVSSVAANGTPNYTTLDVGNVTVYKFSSRHATWINHGTWYQVHGDQPLSDAQLAALVKNA